MALLETNDNNFDNDVLKASGLVLVDFYAPWCGPCKAVTPLLQEIDKEIAEVKIVKLNVDVSPTVSQTQGISGVPTLMLFKDGKVVDTKVGALNREQLMEFIKNHL